MNILDDSADVCSILPSLAPGLLKKVDYIDTIYTYLDRQSARAKKTHDMVLATRLRNISDQLRRLDSDNIKEKKVICVDPDKTVLLAYTFGTMYSEALALVSGHGIRTEVFDDTKDLSDLEVWALSKEYFLNRGKTPVFVRVLEKPVVESVEMAEDSNVYLQLRRMLEQIELTLNLTTFAVEPGTEWVQNVTRDHSHAEVTVNVYNWYCSCMEFTEQISRPHNATSQDILDKISDPVMANWFGHSMCNHITPLPLCMHLLAVVLTVYNMEAAEIDGGQIREV